VKGVTALRPIVIALFLLIAISLGAFGQVSLKHGMRQFGSLGAPGLGLFVNVIRAVFTPYVLLGLALYAVSSGFWLVVISPGGWALSYAYPMIAIGYVGVVLLSRVFFKENVVPLQWVGILFMCTGFALVAYYGASKG
jgi:multidrug transporter EmrE-like cation transporter